MVLNFPQKSESGKRNPLLDLFHTRGNNHAFFQKSGIFKGKLHLFSGKLIFLEKLQLLQKKLHFSLISMIFSCPDCLQMLSLKMQFS